MIPEDILYVLLLFILFVVPRILVRYRLPTAITSLLLGAVAAGFNLFDHDTTVALLASFGIVALFLFAGLEIDVDELRPGARVLGQHLALWGGALAAGALVVAESFELPPRAAWLYALAILTPSTGFILDSLGQFGLSDGERHWTKSKAIGIELLALGVLFVALQSTSLQQMLLSTLALGALIVIVPATLRFFAVRIAPWAPRSEFAFLLMVAVLCAYATRRLGVYYLVGAFIVGVAARQFREKLPAMSSERMLAAVEAFSSFFVPFYFFKAGTTISTGMLSLEAVAIGLVLTTAFVGLRLALVVGHRHLAFDEPRRRSLRIGVAMLPTLVFALVIGEILRERFALPDPLYGALIVYTIASTVLPGFLLRTPPPIFDAPHAPAVLEGFPEAITGDPLVSYASGSGSGGTGRGGDAGPS